MNKKRIIIIVIMVIAGIGLISYPIINKSITNKQQKAMIEDVKKEILKNAKKNDSNEEVATEDDKNNIETESNIEQSLSTIELEENDGEDISVSTDNLGGQNVVGIIEIQKLDLMFAIVEGTAKENIRVAIGHMSGSASIGEKGNCALAGHRGGIYGQFFKYINKLDNGDKVVLTDLNGVEYTYSVYESFIVEPEDISIADPIEGREDENILTLITCENNGKQRLIVRATME